MQFINGNWKPGRGDLFSRHDPSEGELLWSGPAATADDVSKAVAAANAALSKWSRTPAEKRFSVLHRFRDLLSQRMDSLTEMISREVGKPLWDARTEVQAMVAKIDVSLQALKERRSETEISVPGGKGGTRYKPHGVTAVFGPFNFPGHIANGHIVPALAAGNTVVFKPSELTPMTAEATVRLWEEAGLPAGVLNLVQGGKETGVALAGHPEVRAILFTGSLQTGVALRKQLVEQPEKLLALELGGNNPLVVHEVQDVDAAAYWTIQSAFVTGGQRCTCARRLIVTDGCDRFLQRLVAMTERIVVDRPRADPQPYYGSLIHSSAVNQVLAEQERLISGGGVSLVQAKRLELGPAFVSPGIVDVTDCTTVVDEEVFGPLLQVVRVRDLEAAIQAANQTQYGLVAALFSDSAAAFDQFYDGVHAGLINWNRPTTGASGQLPFGGVGRSGNHRPAGYFTVDFCNVPIASLTAATLSLPDRLTPGIMMEPTG